MTLEERIERVEQKIGIEKSNRPELGTIFWMRGLSEGWNLWKASNEGITSIESKTYHPWPSFDHNVSDKAWLWHLLKKPE